MIEMKGRESAGKFAGQFVLKFKMLITIHQCNGRLFVAIALSEIRGTFGKFVISSNFRKLISFF